MKRKKPSRRHFLQAASFVTASLTSRSLALNARPQDSSPELVFSTAQEALRAIRERRISPSELLDQVFTQIEKHNSKINAFVTLNREEAEKQAIQCDLALSQDDELGPLHGLPILVKDIFETAGLKTTAGSLLLKDHIPAEDAVAVARLKQAGAIIVGKTNTPEFAGDMQSYNEIAGTTNNPWDLSRTPGGSTGGGAAALAAGFGFLELGSDIGGSVRVPAHFCGVYAHKPSVGLVPVTGQIPPLPGQISIPSDLNVTGPLARSAADLLLALRVIAGPEVPLNQVLHFELPASRKNRLQDYRIGYLLDDPYCPVVPEVKSILQDTVSRLRTAGLQLKEGWPEGIRFRDMFETYLPLLAAAFAEGQSPEEIELLEKSRQSAWGDYARLWLKGSQLPHAEWRKLTSLRLECRQKWQRYFETFDVFLMPVSFTAAFPHDHQLSFFERSVTTSAGERQYGDLLRWICAPTLSGCPATVAPIGRTAEGLPVGIQIMGPFMEDPTPIDLASRLADLTGGFEPPPSLVSN